MAENAPDGLEGIMMGNVSEEAGESNEQIQARIAAAAAKVQQIKKDETAAHDFDIHLAQLIKSLNPQQLDFVIFMVDHEVPSLTILAFLSIVSDQAGQICYVAFDKDLKQLADISGAGLPATAESKVSYWWTFIYAADHTSKTSRLKELKDNAEFVKGISRFSVVFLHQFLQTLALDNFSDEQLKKILQKYQRGLFA